MINQIRLLLFSCIFGDYLKIVASRDRQKIVGAQVYEILDSKI